MIGNCDGQMRPACTWETRFLDATDREAIEKRNESAKPLVKQPIKQKMPAKAVEHELERLRERRREQSQELKSVRLNDLWKSVVDSAVFIEGFEPQIGIRRQRPFSAGLRTPESREKYAEDAPISVKCLKM